MAVIGKIIMIVNKLILLTLNLKESALIFKSSCTQPFTDSVFAHRYEFDARIILIGKVPSSNASRKDITRPICRCESPTCHGIGTRTSFYLQCFLSVLLANRSWEDTPNVLWTFVATNFGLTIAAISQAEQKQLTLYEGIEVSNLVWLANFSTMLSLASYARQRKHSHREGTKTKHDDMVKYFAVLQTLFSVPLTIYLWATAKTFGSNTDCNSQVIYVFFFANLEAVTKGRIVGLVLTSILTVFYLPMTVSELWRSCGRQHRHRNKSDTARHRRRKPRRDVTLAVPDIEHKKNSIDGILGASLRSVKRIRLSKLDSTLVGIFIFQALLFTYFITCNELYVHRNHTDKSDAQWGFGQILSLVITLPSVVAVVRAFKKHGLKKVRRPESEDLEHGSHDTPDSSDLGSLNYHRREHSGSTLSHRQFASGADGDGAEAEQLLAVPPLIVPRSPRS